MKIIYISGNRDWHGSDRYTLDIARSFTDEGVETEILTKGSDFIDTHFRKAGLTIGKLPLGGDFDFLTPVLLGRKLRRDDARCIVVHTHSLKDTALAVKARKLAGAEGKEIRIVYSCHYDLSASSSPRYVEALEGADAILFASESRKKKFMMMNPGVEAAKLQVIVPTVRVSLDESVPSEDSSAAEPRENILTLLYLGRVAEGKGLETLIEAVAKMRPQLSEAGLGVRLRIGGVGQAPYVKRLKGLVWRYDLTPYVDWLSQLSDVYPEIRKADIGIVPGENTGIVCREFMSQGLPVVRVAEDDVEGDDENGVLTFPTGDSGALAEIIRRLALDVRERLSIGDTGRQCFNERYAFSGFSKHMRTLYTSLFK